jgi:endoglucanase
MTEGTAAPKGGNILKNGDFEEGVLNPWTPIFNPPGKGSAKIDAGQACLTIESAGKATYDVLLRQRPVALKRQRQYQIRFKVRSTSPTKLMPKILSVGSPQVEMWSAVVEATPTTKTFSAPFKWSEELSSDVEMVIHLGGPLAGATPNTVCLDDMAIDDPEASAQDTAAPAIAKVRVNQVGYLPRLPKFAGYKTTSTTPLDWQLLDSAGKVVKSGKTKVFGEDKDAGELVHQIDFSDVKQPGQGYVLAVGNDKSDPFAIGNDIYKKLKYDALAFFYHQRSGIEIAMPYAGNQQWTHPAGHLGDKKVACAPGSGCSYSLDVSGGWYDAGDHGKYVVNGGITVWTLLNWYERTKLLGSSLGDYADGKLQIPENKNGKNDLLDEVRWELELFMKMQVPDGEKLAGMLHHKMHNEKWSGIPTRPEEDKIPRFLKPPSTTATLNHAAVGAQCARIWKDIDAVFANKCLVSAEKAWVAAEKNPKLYPPGDDFKSGGGAYGDIDAADEKYWAAAELFITTNKPEYLKAMQQSKQYLQVPTNAGGGLSAMGWANVTSLGTISLAVVPSQLPKADVSKAREAVVGAAQKFMSVIEKNGYRVPLVGPYPWGSNSFVANNGVIFGLAYDFTKKEAFLAAAVDSLDYLLGRNAMAKSYVSGYGARPLQNPHHRFWAHQQNDKFPPPPAGVLSGGPNSRADDPQALAAGLAGCAAQKCYIDHIQSWTTNEIAINWNAPLVWLAGFVDEKSGKP